ncbi:hypothetical protein [uncultured Chryseobacterium sp.]|uniref:hypothetical protein n=1 Tax=uncultured Chryseobacterium sp. TaxID=259322 RepID=UPI0025F4CCC0|nr:hypothetical protein [uncultured Chryseobacterium sp.]
MNPKITLPATLPHHHQLNQLLNSLSEKVPVRHIFLSNVQTSGHPFLIIYLSGSRLPDGLVKEKHIRKTCSRYGIRLIILAGTDLEKHLKSGSLFLERHCNASTLVFTSGKHELPAENRSQSLKKFRHIRRKYAFTCRLLGKEIRKAESTGSLITAYHLYISLFAHHLFHLEFLCLGLDFHQDTLDQRMLRLELFFPEIRSFLLKKTGSTYFITEALLSAGKAEADKEYSHLRSEFREAIALAEKKLHGLVKRTFRNIKAAVKHPDTLPKNPVEKKAVSPYESIISILTRRFPVEEIFLFHREEFVSEGRTTTELYLLLIGNRINKKDLEMMQQTVSRKTGGKYSIVPIAHSARRIQEHLWESQPFFRKVMQPQNTIYASVSTLIHWHTREPDLCTDEEVSFQQFNALYENYKTLYSQKQPSDAEGIRLAVKDIIRQAFLLFIYNRLHYRANEKTGLRTLWKLCIYAGSEIKTFSSVIRNLPFDFSSFLEQAENPEEHPAVWNDEVFSVVDSLLKSFMGYLEPV